MTTGGDDARRRRRRPARGTSASPPPERDDRALRELTGAGSSRLGVDGALRARDVNRPSADELAEAERELVVVRRNWTPPERSR